MQLLIQTDSLVENKELEALDPTSFSKIPELLFRLIVQRKPHCPVDVNMLEKFLPIVYPKYKQLVGYPLLAQMLADVVSEDTQLEFENLYQLFDRSIGNQVPTIDLLFQAANLKIQNLVDVILAQIPPPVFNEFARSWHGKLTFKYPMLAELFITKCLIQNIHLKAIAELLLKRIFVDQKYAIISCLIDEAMLRQVFSEYDYRACDTVLYDSWNPRATEFSQCKSLNKLLFVLLDDGRFEIFKFLTTFLLKRPQIFINLLMSRDRMGNSVLDFCILRLPEEHMACLAKFVVHKVSMDKLVEMSRLNLIQAVFWSNYCHTNIDLAANIEVKQPLLSMASNSSQVFLEKCLKFLSNEKNCRFLWKLLNQVNDSGCNMLHVSVESNTIAAVKSIVTFLNKFNSDCFRELLQETDDFGENVFFKAVKSPNLKMIETIVKLFHSDPSLGVVEWLLSARDKASRNLMLAAVTTGNGPLIESVLAILKSELSTQEYHSLLSQSNDAGENLIYVAIKYCDMATVIAIQEIVKTELGHHIFDAMVRQETKANTNLLYLILTRSYQHQVTKDILFRKIRQQISPSLFHPFLCADNDENFNLLHNAVRYSSARGLRLMFEFLEQELGLEVSVNMLLTDAKNRATLLHIAAASRGESFLKYLMFFLKETVGQANFRTMLQRTDSDGDAIFHVAVKQRNCSVFQYLVDVYSAELGVQFADASLVHKNFEDKTILQLAIEGIEYENHENFLQFLLDMLEVRLGGDRFIEFLSNMDNTGHYLMHVAVRTGRRPLVEFVFSILKRKLNSSIFDLMITSSDVCNSNIGLLAIEHGDMTLVEYIFEHCSLSMIHHRLWNDMNAIHLAVQAQDEKVLQFVMEYLIQLSLPEKDTNHRNVLHLAAVQTQPSGFIMVLDNIANDLDLSNMLAEKDKDGLNPLHIVVKCQRRRAICEIFECLRARLSKNEFSKILQLTTSARENILHLAAEHTNALTLNSLIEHVGREFQDQKLLDDSLLAKNEKLQTLLLIAAKKGDHQMVSQLLFQYSLLLDQGQCQEMLTTQTRQGSNLLTFAVQANNVSLFERFLELLRATIGIERVRLQLLTKIKLEYHFSVLTAAVCNCDLPAIIAITEILEDAVGKREFSGNYFVKGFLNHVIASGQPLVIRHFFEMLNRQNLLSVELKNLNYQYFDECSAAVIDDIMQLAKAELGPEEFPNFLVSISFLFVCIRNGNKAKIVVVLKILSENLDEPTLHKTLMSKEKETGFNVVLYAAHYLDATVVRFLIGGLVLHLSCDDIEDLLCQTGSDGSNILHNYIRRGSKREIRAIIEFLLGHLSGAKLSQMVLATTKRRNNTMHIAMIRSNPHTIDWLLRFLETILPRERIDGMLRQKSKRGSHLFHHAVKANEHFIVPYVYEMLKRRFNEGMANQMLLQSNKIDQNVVFICGLYGSTSTFKHLITYMAEIHVQLKTVVKQLRASDINQESLLMCAARNPDVRMFGAVVDCLHQKLPNPSEVTAMMHASNKNGLTILHVLASAQVYFDGYYDQLLDKSIANALCAKTKKGYSVVEVACRREEDIALENFLEWINRFDSNITQELIADVLMKLPSMQKTKKQILLDHQKK